MNFRATCSTASNSFIVYLVPHSNLFQASELLNRILGATHAVSDPDGAFHGRRCFRMPGATVEDHSSRRVASCRMRVDGSVSRVTPSDQSRPWNVPSPVAYGATLCRVGWVHVRTSAIMDVRARLRSPMTRVLDLHVAPRTVSRTGRRDAVGKDVSSVIEVSCSTSRPTRRTRSMRKGPRTIPTMTIVRVSISDDGDESGGEAAEADRASETLEEVSEQTVRVQ